MGDSDKRVRAEDVVVRVAQGADPQLACRLEEVFGLTTTSEDDPSDSCDLYLSLDEDGLSLTDGKLVLQGDFSQMVRRAAPANLSHELLVRAARLKGVAAPTVVDATAGLGEDSFLLAAAGFSVVLCERDPIVAALLDDALRRGTQAERVSDVVVRMRLEPRDALDVLPQLETPPDVVFLDPMFPAKRKNALTNKKLQLIQRLERPCTDETALMEVALRSARAKVVVKRPLKGAYLGGIKPNYSLTGKTVRYDCIVTLGH